MLGLTVAMATLIPRLKISSSYNDLVSPDDPEQKRFFEFLEEFGATEELIVVLEGKPETLKDSADYFARRIENRKDYVSRVFYRIDIEKILRRAPLYLSEEKLREGLEFVSRRRYLFERLSDLHNLPSILRLIEEGLAGNAPDLRIDPGDAAEALQAPLFLFRQWKQWLQDPERDGFDPADIFGDTPPEEISIITSRGYITSRDGRMLFLFVQPRSTSESIDHLKPFISSVRSACEGVFQEKPGLRGEVTVAFTGMPAHAMTEVETIDSDVAKATLISVGLVIILLFAGFHSFKKIIIAVIPLACGMVITLGLTVLTVGHLNLVSSSFLAVLFGIGIDFGIYLVRRDAEEIGRGATREEAVRKAVMASGRGVLTGGLTTAFAFLAIGFSDFVGFSELGIIAGLGVLVVLLSTFLMLPSLLLRRKIEPHRYHLDWIVKFTRKKKERMVLILIVSFATAFCLFGIYATTRVECDFNALKLLPPEAESTVYQIKMQEESDLQISCAMVTASGLGQLRELAARLEKIPSVVRVDSFAGLIPENQEEKIKIIGSYRPYLSGFRVSYRPSGLNAAGYLSLLEGVARSLEETQEDAFAGGRADIVEEIEENLAEIRIIRQKLSGEGKTSALARTGAFEKALFLSAVRADELVQSWLGAGPIGEDYFSAGLRSRFESPGGLYAAYIYPDRSIWDVEFLRSFVGRLKELTPTATGFPVTYLETVDMVFTGLFQSMVYALIIILILLVIDFRRLSAVALVLIPLVVATCWVQAIVYLMGRSYNFAALAGLPLLLGLGIVYGVHIVHRWREHPGITAFEATATSGKGVAFAALTTCAGLFGLLFSRHRGVASFGIIILIGILSALVAALYVLPAVIDLIYLKNKNISKKQGIEGNDEIED